jgi:hypothetical protein
LSPGVPPLPPPLDNSPTYPATGEGARAPSVQWLLDMDPDDVQDSESPSEKGEIGGKRSGSRAPYTLGLVVLALAVIGGTGVVSFPALTFGLFGSDKPVPRRSADTAQSPKSLPSSQAQLALASPSSQPQRPTPPKPHVAPGVTVITVPAVTAATIPVPATSPPLPASLPVTLATRPAVSDVMAPAAPISVPANVPSPPASSNAVIAEPQPTPPRSPAQPAEAHSAALSSAPPPLPASPPAELATLPAVSEVKAPPAAISVSANAPPPSSNVVVAEPHPVPRVSPGAVPPTISPVVTSPAPAVPAAAPALLKKADTLPLAAPAAVPAAAPFRVMLNFTADEAKAAEGFARALQRQGFTVVSIIIPVTPGRWPGVAFFFDSDGEKSRMIARELGDVTGRHEHARLSARHPYPKPGTVEVSLLKYTKSKKATPAHR